MTLLQAQTLDDIVKLMAKQKAVSTKAVRELNREVESTAFIYKADRTLSETSSQELTRRVQSLLFRYASQPTLTEFYQHPSWDGGFVYGGGFGVSAIVGTIFLKSWAEIFPEFAKIVKPVMMRVLEEQSKEDDDDETAMIDRILPSMKFIIRDGNGVEILGKDRDKMMYNRVASLLQLIAQSFVTYGVLEVPEDQHPIEEGQQVAARLTPFGLRILLHLQDVEVYIQEISELYPRLSKNKIESESKVSQ